MGKIKSFKEVCKVCHKFRKEGKSVVFCHGFFDILHRGHVELLVSAKKLGNILVVGVDHDENVKKLKGKGRPINDHESRMFVLVNLEPVNFVFLVPSFKKYKSTDMFWSQIYKSIRPDIIASSLSAGKYGLVRKRRAEKLGIRFADLSDYIHKNNTSKIAKILKLEQ